MKTHFSESSRLHLVIFRANSKAASVFVFLLDLFIAFKSHNNVIDLPLNDHHNALVI